MKFVFPVIFLLISSPAFCEDIYFANVFSNNSEPHHVVLVEKAEKKLHLLNVQGDNHSVKTTVDVLVGSNMLPKRVEGDMATPLGIFYIVSKHTSQELLRAYGNYALIYGMGAYPTNYPNPIDRALGRTGYGIWLHGLNPAGHKPNTEGCVAMKNTDLFTINNNLFVGQAVVIVDKAEPMHADAYFKKREEFFKDLNRFFDMWRESRYNEYKDFIHPKYKSYAAKSAEGFLSGKKSLMQTYKKRVINFDNINVYFQGDTLVYDADQFYCAENLSSYARKKYYFARDGENLKLISEEIKNKDKSAYLQHKAELFVRDWAAAWQDKDIDRYESYYTKNIADDRWREFKKGVFDKAGSIEVKIENIEWHMDKGGMEVRFLQHYKSETVEDVGYKTLLIKGCPSEFLINKESFMVKK